MELKRPSEPRGGPSRGNNSRNPRRSDPQDYFYHCLECCYRWQERSSSEPQDKRCEKCRESVKGSLGPENDVRMFGKYCCWQCERGWQSANSWFYYPQNCKTCSIEIYAYEREDIDRPKYGYYRCTCGEEWESEDSWLNYPQTCDCGKEVFAYKRVDIDRSKHGYFSCRCGEAWESEGSSKDYSEMCYSCGNYVFPYKIENLRENKIDPDKPHPMELCGKCKELGRSCFRSGGSDYQRPALSNSHGSERNTGYYSYGYDYDSD